MKKPFSKAESQGFEPRVPCGTMVFKTIAFDHSANSPKFADWAEGILL